MGIAGVFVLQGFEWYHDYRGICEPAYAKL